MFKTLLVCLDGSSQDDALIDCSIALARSLGAILHGLHVKDIIALEGPLLYDISGSLAFVPQMNLITETRKILEERGKTILSAFEARCQKESIPCHVHLEEGVVHRKITDKAQLHDLTIMGRRGLNYKLDRDFMGSTADRVIRKTSAPILVVPHEFQNFKTPLLAYDGSQASREAMVSSVRLLTELQLPLTVLHVSENIEEGKRVLDEAREYLEAYSLQVKYEWASGAPRQQIPLFAKNHQHDLLILGARGHRGIVDFLLGSTTEYCLWQEHCPIFVDR